MADRLGFANTDESSPAILEVLDIAEVVMEEGVVSSDDFYGFDCGDPSCGMCTCVFSTGS